MDVSVAKLPVLRRLFRRIRRRRLKRFLEMIKPVPGETILDVGGTLPTWSLPETERLSAILLNLGACRIPENLQSRLQSAAGDATGLTYADSEFKVVYSNSVIEHVGTYENQVKMAGELRRVGQKLWVQTPAHCFIFEPHYIAPFIHWFPVPMRRLLVRRFTLWGLLNRPTKQEVEDQLQELRLLTYKEMRELFPDCRILRERFLGMTKSYIAVRKECRRAVDSPSDS